MKKICTLFTLLLLVSPALAADDLAARLSKLEANQAELYHTLAEKKSPGNLTAIAENISLSGLLEVEAVVESIENQAGKTESSSDLALATAQLGFGFQPLEQVSFDIGLLYEGAGSDFEVDEALITLEGERISASIGQQYLPFGVYYSHFVSDPLVLEIGETRETALVTAFDLAPVSLSLFAFNGAAEKSDDSEEHLRDWGASLSVSPLEGLEFGASYLSDLADSDGELLLDETTNPDNLFSEQVAGWSAFLVWAHGPFGISAEALGAVERFAVADLDADGNGQGDKPFAYNLELFHSFGEHLEVAARYEESSELVAQPERQYGLCGSWGIDENLSVSLEYLHGEFDPDFAPDGEDQRHLATLQLAVAL